MVDVISKDGGVIGCVRIRLTRDIVRWAARGCVIMRIRSSDMLGGLYGRRRAVRGCLIMDRHDRDGLSGRDGTSAR